MSIWSREEEIEALFMERPHVVLLGAGASYAAFPDGDKNRNKLPLMANFVQTLELSALLQQYGINPPYNDFEAIYSDISTNDGLSDLCLRIENKIEDYFSKLELPDYPTLYDHLILSLRPKDVIATFNWDPFLTQAVIRNLHFIKNPPIILFLHGNVTYRYCENCKIGLPNQLFCNKCGRELKKAPLLYPVKEKNYQSHPVIRSHWHGFRHHLKSAWAFTVFGYSAPKTDIEAVELMKDAWGDVNSRELEQAEIIDIQNEDDLIETWSPFIHTHHYDIRSNFYDSFITEFPRRSGEALWAQLMECKWLDPHPFPKDEKDFGALYKYFEQKIHKEISQQITP